jgi:outer membrane lipoprotein-sorting protein
MRSNGPGWCAAFVVGILVIGAAAAHSAPAAVSGVFEYETEMVAKGQPLRKMTQKVWVKGARYRTETTMSKGKEVMISGPDGTIMFSPGSKEAAKMPMRPGAKPAATGSPFGDITKIKQTMKKVGKEKVGDYTADLYEQTTTMNQRGRPPGQRSNRYWISDRLPVPVKMMQKLPVMQVTMTLKSAQPNAPVPDSMFQPPRGMKIREMKLPQGMRPAPKQK